MRRVALPAATLISPEADTNLSSNIEF